MGPCQNRAAFCAGRDAHLGGRTAGLVEGVEVLGRANRQLFGLTPGHARAPVWRERSNRASFGRLRGRRPGHPPPYLRRVTLHRQVDGRIERMQSVLMVLPGTCHGGGRSSSGEADPGRVGWVLRRVFSRNIDALAVVMQSVPRPPAGASQDGGAAGGGPVVDAMLTHADSAGSAIPVSC